MSTPFLHSSAPSPPTLGSTPTGVETALLKNELLMSNGIRSQFEATEFGNTAETIAGWRRLFRLLTRKMGEHLSPACLDEFIKARALKFSRLNRLDQLIQSRAQKMNGARVFNGRVMLPKARCLT